MTVMLFNMLPRVMSSDKPATYYQMCFKHYDRWGKNVFSLLILSVGLSYQFFFHLCLHEREAGERERERMREQEHESERESFTLFMLKALSELLSLICCLNYISV